MVIGRSVVTGFLNGSVLLYLLSGAVSSVFRVWDCRRISCTEKKKKKKRRFIRFGDILAFFHSIFFSPWISKDALFNGCFNVYKVHVISIFDNVHEKLSLLTYVKTQEI